MGLHASYILHPTPPYSGTPLLAAYGLACVLHPTSYTSLLRHAASGCVWACMRPTSYILHHPTQARRFWLRMGLHASYILHPTPPYSGTPLLAAYGLACVLHPTSY